MLRARSSTSSATDRQFRGEWTVPRLTVATGHGESTIRNALNGRPVSDRVTRRHRSGAALPYEPAA
jgi:hypothetical protein